MSSKVIFFGYISFSREKVDAAKQAMSKRGPDYLRTCFDPSRVVQDGPTEEHPNMSFSIMLDTDDVDDILTDIVSGIQQLPWLSYAVVAEKEKVGIIKMTSSLHSGEMVRR